MKRGCTAVQQYSSVTAQKSYGHNLNQLEEMGNLNRRGKPLQGRHCLQDTCMGRLGWVRAICANVKRFIPCSGVLLQLLSCLSRLVTQDKTQGKRRLKQQRKRRRGNNISTIIISSSKPFLVSRAYVKHSMPKCAAAGSPGKCRESVRAKGSTKETCGAGHTTSGVSAARWQELCAFKYNVNTYTDGLCQFYI